ncbi:hypothetical protein I4U23_023656 [Adineta vaga]|nr:hypothetical protein I4U23_023656 [Adineta vaga]
MQQFNSRTIWLSICLLSAILTAIAAIIILSLIPIYLPYHNLYSYDDADIVPSPNLMFSFASDISPNDASLFNHSTIMNTNEISRQLESIFQLKTESLSVSAIEPVDFSSDDKNRKRRAVNSASTIGNSIDLIIRVTINYLFCGRSHHCKIKLHDRIIQMINTSRRKTFPITLLFNNNVQLLISVASCMAQSLTSTGPSQYTRLRGKSCINSDLEICTTDKLPDLYDASIEELQKGLGMGYFTSVDLVQAYLARIDEINLKGPALRAVIEISPVALEAAHTADVLRAKGTILSSLHGIPILLKDNIATRAEDGMNTTAGSFALLGSIPPDDATVAKKLRNAGAILLGKTSLSEWANFRGINITNGWSARGGQATSAFYPLGDACGSSTGSGIAASIGLAAGTLGTETDGSIVCPSNRNNLVGIKPTVGLTSRNLVIPISHNQDTIGPMCRSVADAAAILNIIAGRDTNDNATLSQNETVSNYTRHLIKDGLKGARIGVLRRVFANATYGEYPEHIISVFNKTIEDTFKKLGAIIFDPADLAYAEKLASGDAEFLILTFDLKVDLERYLSRLINNNTVPRTLQDLIDYNNRNQNIELPPGRSNQLLFLASQNTTNLQDLNYTAAIADNIDFVKNRGIDALFDQYKLDALIAPTEGYTSRPPAITGYPIITVPLGFLPDTTEVKTNANTTLFQLPIWPAPNFPFGLSFIGRAYSESKLIELAYSYEQATQNYKNGKPFQAALPKTQISDILCRK